MFSKAKTTVTIIADVNPSTDTPGKKFDSKYTTIAVSNTLIIVFIIQI